MLRNYLKTTWRSLIRNRNYALINLTGLTLGLGVANVYGYDSDGLRVFALSGGFAGLVALLTVSVQSVKAALMNPVTSLRSD